MSNAAQAAANLIEILPESEQNFAVEFITKLVRAWDPDYTKLTPDEAKYMEEAEKDFVNGDAISHDDINWN